MKTYYKECFVEQVYHYEALKIWQDLKTGDNFHLIYDDKQDKVEVKQGGQMSLLLNFVLRVKKIQRTSE